MSERRLRAREIRREAAEVAFEREHPAQINNGEEFKYRICEKPSHIANFTKGLPHDVKTGLLANPDNYQQFVRGIDSGDVRDFKDTPLGPREQDEKGCPIWQSQIAQNNGDPVSVRAWESQGAGLTFDLEGPDAQSVTIPPAPKLDSAELITEMIEVYSMALLRDLPFSEFARSQKVQQVIQLLNNSQWFRCTDNSSLSPFEQKRRRSPFNLQTVFRGITPGDDIGPYISQFLLIGNQPRGVEISKLPEPSPDGFIRYGSIRIDQRVRVAQPNKDYMTTWEAWIDTENGADVRLFEEYSQNPKYRFIATPRDLATYVHYDALYQAYLNACLLMLEMAVPFDPGIPFQLPDNIDKQQGFAQFGGPHILTLVTEVATRALKAVRFQKFNVHRRLRPEAVGALVHRYQSGDTKGIEVIKTLVEGLGEELLHAVADYNKDQNQKHPDRIEDQSGKLPSYLLPMAFPEGSPMHPSYGAGHATVAGACVTILKAFFDHGAQLKLLYQDNPFAYEASPDGSCLQKVSIKQPLTVEGELNKLASNISVGRNWAGVHYFSDYIESIRLGEEIALGILEEQKLTYGENFSMTVPLFDGGTVRI